MEVSIELLRMLDDNEEPLTKRIRLAKNAFISKHLPMQTKDQIIESKEERALKWLCGLFENEEAWKALQQCLHSDRVKSYKYLYISPSTRTSLISKLCDHLNRDYLIPKKRLLLFECSLCLLNIPIFKQHFNRSLSDYTSLIGALIRCLFSIENEFFHDLCMKITTSLKFYSQKFYQNDKFRNLFHLHILWPLSHLLQNEKWISEFKNAFNELHKCISLTLFPKKKIKYESELMDQLFYRLLQGEELEIQVDIIIFQHLHSALSTLTSSEFFSLISVVFKSFILSCRKDGVRHCQLFLILCYLLGFKPIVQDGRPLFSTDVEYFFSMSAMVFSKKKLPYHSLKAMCDVLNKENVDINVDIAGFTFISWLQGLCECVILREELIDEPVLVVLTAFSDLDPNILDSHTVKVIGPAMLKRSAKSKRDVKKTQSSYINFLKSLLQSSLKLHRIQKLASRLLSSAKEQVNLEPSLGSTLTVEDVLPKEFCSEFGSSMQLLVFTQAMAMLKTLMFHLLEDCVQPMEQGKCDSAVNLMLQLTKCLICEFLLGYRAIDPNIPDSKMEKFGNLMNDLGSIIGRLGKALLLDKHNPITMGAFLELSHCWGDLQLLLIFYQPDKPSSDLSSLTEFPQLPSAASPRFWSSSRGNSVTTATDFSNLHPHLSEGEWSHLVERIVNFGDDTCKEKLDELVIQKLRTLQLFEPNIQSDKAHSCVHHLMSKANDSSSALSLLAENSAIVTQLLDLGEVTQLSELIIAQADLGNDKPFVAFRSNAVIVPVTTLSILKKIGKKVFSYHSDSPKQRKRRHGEGEKELGCSGGEILSKKKVWGPGTALSFDLFASVAETLSFVVKEHGSVSIDQQLLRQNNESASKLPMKIATMLDEYLETCAKSSDDLTGSYLSMDYSALVTLLKTLSLLPLPHLSENSRAVVIMCLVGLLIALREHHLQAGRHQAEALTTEVILLTIKAYSVFKELVNYLHVGKFLTWYISEKSCLDSNHDDSEIAGKLTNLQELLLERFVEVGISSPTGIQQLKVIVDAVKMKLKEGDAEIGLICSLSSILMTAFVKKCAKSSAKAASKKLCRKYYRSLSVTIIKMVNLDPLNMNRQKLECFFLVLQKFISINSQKRLPMATAYLEGLINMVKERFSPSDDDHIEVDSTVACESIVGQSKKFDSCCLQFIDMLLSCRMQLKSNLSTTFAWDMWQIMISAPACSLIDQETFLKTIKTLLICSNKKEFIFLTNDLLDKLRSLDPSSPNPSKIRHYMLFWSSLVQCSLNKGVADWRQTAVKEATSVFLCMTRNWEGLVKQPNTSIVTMVIPILEFEHVLLRSGKVTYLGCIAEICHVISGQINLHHQMLDLVFESVSAVPLNELFTFVNSEKLSDPGRVKQCFAEFRQAFLSCSAILLALVTHHSDHLVDRIPSFLQCLTKLFTAAVAHGNIEYSSAGGLQGGRLSQNLLAMTDCAGSVEWITNALVKFKKDFARVAPYFIADAVHSFESKPVHPAVKNHLHNCIYGFVYMCDTNGIAYLHHALPAGSKEIFKTIYESYKKYYKFKGKI